MNTTLTPLCIFYPAYLWSWEFFQKKSTILKTSQYFYLKPMLRILCYISTYVPIFTQHKIIHFYKICIREGVSITFFFDNSVYFSTHLAKGQLISDQINAVLNFPKNQRPIAKISPLASKMGQVRGTLSSLLISVYLQFGIKNCLYLFDITHFRG